jgi:hypothetical protein
MENLKICIDRPLSLLNLHSKMRNSIIHNPYNNPTKEGTDEHRIVNKFVSNPRQNFKPEEVAIISRMALITDNKWQPGTTLTISFLNGSDVQKQKTQEMAKEWLDYADIQFQYIDTMDGAIRISFGYDAGSWSYIGTECLSIAADKPTMNFGWLEDNTADSEWRRVVVHEFGHALGCVHEHNSPAGGIQWNKPVVYQYYEGPPNNWSKEDVDNNLFATYDADKTQFTALDPNSIMMYSRMEFGFIKY